MHKKLIARIKSAIIAVLTATALTTSAYGADVFDTVTQISDSGNLTCGAFMKDAATGEVTYLPPHEVSTYSTETEGNTPSYDPYLDKEYIGDLIQPLMDNNMEIVEDPASSPSYKSTVYIITYDVDGKEIGRGTGFLISKNVVVTAGHVVYDDRDSRYNNDGWINSAVVTPAAHPAEGSKPFGTIKGNYFICGGDWAKYLDYDDDWGVIILDTNIGPGASWLGMHSQLTSYDGTSVRANGYYKFFPYTVSGTITSSKSKTLLSYDVYVERGMSGGPCYIHSDEYGFQAIGIIINYTSFDSGGVYHDKTIFRRINKTLYNTLKGYCDEFAI